MKAIITSILLFISIATFSQKRGTILVEKPDSIMIDYYTKKHHKKGVKNFTITGEFIVYLDKLPNKINELDSKVKSDMIINAKKAKSELVLVDINDFFKANKFPDPRGYRLLYFTYRNKK